MNITLNLKKGLNLDIAGGITDSSPCNASTVIPSTVALTPDDFPGLTLKPVVKEGEEIAEGTPILQDKNFTNVKICSPVAGTVKSVVRGDRRKLERIVIEPINNNYTATTSTPIDINKLSSDELHTLLQENGLWAFMRQRPYDIVATPTSSPRDIFVTTFDSNPLAPDYDDLLATNIKELEAGVNVLSKLTDGTVYVARKAGSRIPDIAGATMIDVAGAHPAGNVGVHIANIKPVNKGDIVWTLDGTTLARIGSLILTGKTSWTTVVAITGSEVNKPSYVQTVIGADISSLLKDRIKQDGNHHRIISGNVLTGLKVSNDDYLRFPYHQITVIPEGDDVVEFMGWATLSPKKMSTSRSFPGHFIHKIFNPDARLLGGRRAMIMSGEYDKLLPMDIMTEYLVKAILSKDIEKMEQLGIYEIAPEDVALAEYACTSKMPLQSIVAGGLEYLRKELE